MYLPLLLGLLLAGETHGQADTRPAPGGAVPAQAASELGPPLVVDGIPITEFEIQRTLIYGKGRASLESRRVAALIEDEVARRVAQGADPAQFEITPADFQRMHERRVADFKQRYPTLDLETEITRTYSSRPWYEREMYLQMRFDRVFIPDNPEEWPEVTFEALRAEAGELLIDDCRQSYERRMNHWVEKLAAWEEKVAAGEDAGPEPDFPPEDSMYRSILRQIVRDALFGTVVTKTAFDGLPPHLVATMSFDPEGEPEFVWTTEELWQDVRPIISQKDIVDARRYLAKVTATRKRLEREGLLASPEQVKAAMQEVTGELQSSLFNLQAVAVTHHQFPSLESYAQYYDLYESWRRHLAPQLASPPEGGLPLALREHLNRANRIMGLAQVNCEVLLVSAFDFPTNRWIEDGWEKARERANWIKQEFDANQVRHTEYRKRRLEGTSSEQEGAPETPVRSPDEYWSMLLDDHSDYWDPPPAAVGNPGSNVGFKMKGRFGDRYRNDLETQVGESYYYHFLHGTSVTDHIFFDQEVGTVDGPFEGRVGYYLTRLNRRGPPTRPLNVQNEKHLELLRDDYVRYSLIAYAEESLRQAQVSGL